MKNLVLLVSFVLSCVCASAQKVFFIYLQSDNYRPFYVKMNDKIYSSSTSGYLILSSLVDSTYNFAIGFPSSQPESRFSVSLKGKDKGFLIKDFDTGLGLFDLQTLTITNAIKDDSPKNISYIRRNDEFSSMLSKAANDTTLLYAVVYTKEPDVVVQQQQAPAPEENKKVEEKPLAVDSTAVVSSTVMVADTKKEDVGTTVQSNGDVKKEAGIIGVTAVAASQKDTANADKQQPPPTAAENVTTPVDSSAAKTAAVTPVAMDTVTAKPIDSTALTTVPAEVTYKKSIVKKHSESSTSEGFGLVFYDNYDEGQDTIRLLIPNPPIIFKQSTPEDSMAAAKEFIHVDDLKKEAEVAAPIVVAVKGDPVVKTNCKSLAGNNDFLKLRKNMASENSDDAMVGQAKKFFKTKCFTTEQVKNLSALFLTSAGKYQFFDAAYLHVSDQQNFSSLESEIKDDYYLKRFKALVSN